MSKVALVTGGSGLIGGYIVRGLESTGYIVYTCDIKEDGGGSGDIHNVLPKLDTRFDLVVHCAYQQGCRRDMDGDPMWMATNLKIDAELFEWAVRTRQKRVLYFSSVAAYNKHDQDVKYMMPLKESQIDYDWAKEPSGTYGWAKLTGERMAQAAIASGVPVHIVRPFTTYAAHQPEDRPFPAIIKQARARQDPFEIWGDGSHVRDWIHAADVAAGALAVVANDYEEPVNLCTGTETSALELATMACNRIGFEPEFKNLEGMPTGPRFQVGDPTVLRNFYKPRIALDEAVDKAMKWAGR